MTNELKTLNDIHMEEYMRLIIRGEVIKWVKNYQKIIDNGVKSMNVFKLEGAIESMSHFHNITEEELNSMEVK